MVSKVKYTFFGYICSAVDGRHLNFSGWFNHDSCNGSVDGELEDFRGSAKIIGEMSGDKLSLKADYNNHAFCRDYLFEKEKDREGWSGSFVDPLTKAGLVSRLFLIGGN